MNRRSPGFLLSTAITGFLHLLVRVQPVSHARLGDDVVWTRWVWLELAPQVADVDAQHVHLLLVAHAPDLSQQLAVRQHFARVCHQHAAQVMLQVDRQLRFSSLFWLSAQARLRPRLAGDVLIEERRRFGMVHMQRMVVIPRRRRWFVAHRPDHAEQLVETGDGDKQAVAVLLHLDRLPLDDGTHRALHARLVADDAANLFR